jgi:hypothetical protein
MSQMIYCPKCGDQNTAGAQFCKTCGSRLSTPANPEAMAPTPPPVTPPPISSAPQPQYAVPPPGAPPQKSNRAVIALVLGILGIFCCGPLSSIPGIIVAKMEMDAIARGEASAENLGMAKAAFWVSIGATALSVLGVCAYVALVGSMAGLGAIF